MDNFKF